MRRGLIFVIFAVAGFGATAMVGCAEAHRALIFDGRYRLSDAQCNLGADVSDDLEAEISGGLASVTFSFTRSSDGAFIEDEYEVVSEHIGERPQLSP